MKQILYGDTEGNDVSGQDLAAAAAYHYENSGVDKELFDECLEHLDILRAVIEELRMAHTFPTTEIITKTFNMTAMTGLLCGKIAEIGERFTKVFGR